MNVESKGQTKEKILKKNAKHLFFTQRRRTFPAQMVIAIAVAAAMLASCKNKPQSPVVAKAGSQVLTLDDLYKSIPQEYSDYVTREQMVTYVKQWIDNQILYQEALRRKIDKDEVIRERLKKMKQDLLCAEMINRNNGGQNIQISEDLIQHYYNENKAKFVHKKESVRYVQILVDNQNSAWDIKSKITADNFMDYASQFSKIPVPELKSVPYLNIDEIPAAIASAINTMQINSVSKPVKTDKGYYLILLLGQKPKGTVMDIDEVRDEITNILTTQMQNVVLEQMLAKIRSTMLVELHLDAIPDNQKNPPDSTGNPDSMKTAPEPTSVN
jgi:parvulin-like peptidyl-prolyl isomerase